MTDKEKRGKKTRGYSIVTKIMALSIVLVICPTILWSLTWRQSLEEREYNNRLYTADQLAGQVELSMQQKMNVINSFSYIIANDLMLNQIVSFRTTDRELISYILNDLKPLISLLTFQMDCVNAVRIIHNNKGLFNVQDLLYYHEDFDERKDKFVQSLKGNGISDDQYTLEYMQTGHLYPFHKSSRADTDVWYLTRNMDPTRVSNFNGLIEIAIDNAAFTDALARIDMLDGMGCALISKEGKIITENEFPDEIIDGIDFSSADTGITASPDGRYSLVMREYAPINAYIVMYVSKNEPNAGMLMWGPMFNSIFLVALGLSALAFFVTRMITTRLKKLTRTIDDYQPGQLTVMAEAGGGDEISRLIRHFNRLSVRIVEASARERQFAHAELISQIKPHFLINALDMLRVQVEQKGESDIARCALQISVYFRHVLMNGDNMVTLTEELNNINNYVSLINSMRPHPVRLQILLDSWFERSETEIYIPALILQPLVENAIKHGIRDMCGGSINIRVFKDDMGMNISIEDNGRGIPEKSVEKLNDLAVDYKGCERENGHIGIGNIVRRLALKYPDSYRLTFESVEGVGTNVLMSIEEEALKKNSDECLGIYTCRPQSPS